MHAYVCAYLSLPYERSLNIEYGAPAARRWDCASVIFSILHSARVVSSISRGARTLLFVYPPPHSHSAFILPLPSSFIFLATYF